MSASFLAQRIGVSFIGHAEYVVQIASDTEKDQQLISGLQHLSTDLVVDQDSGICRDNKSK